MGFKLGRQACIVLMIRSSRLTLPSVFLVRVGFYISSSFLDFCNWISLDFPLCVWFVLSLCRSFSSGKDSSGGLAFFTFQVKETGERRGCTKWEWKVVSSDVFWKSCHMWSMMDSRLDLSWWLLLSKATSAVITFK